MTQRSALNFCCECGGPLLVRQVPGDPLARRQCSVCRRVHYVNPKVVVGCIPECEDGRVLMCQRRIKPRQGLWTFPSGFLECGETSAQCAAREAHEETGGFVRVDDMLCVIDVPQINEVHLIYRAALLSRHIGPTAESSQVALFSESEIPWEQLAFSTIARGLRLLYADRAMRRRDFHLIDLTEHAHASEFEEIA
jgi:ADP-ribose pyrophosphatase YjhB (NUDIX family)